ncbi:MAG TPA: hypothetical protein DCS93_17585 [Microscillaceae bacterium]|nr:hypothetical protein [Microscillaceae bacterium]
MSTIEDQMKKLWQTYPQEGGDEAFWQAYEQLRQRLPTKTAKIAKITKTIIRPTSPTPTSRLVLPPILMRHLEIAKGKKIAAKAHDLSLYKRDEIDTGMTLSVVGVVTSLILVLSFGVQGLGSITLFLLFTSLVVLVLQARSKADDDILKNLAQTYLKVDKEGIERLTWGVKTKKLLFKDISLITKESFGLVLKVKNKRGKDVDALAIPQELEMFEELQKFLFQQVRKNNGVPTTQGQFGTF